MSFWNTFVKVWQVRTSIKIQEYIEESYRVSKKSRNSINTPKIIDELNKKNEFWEEKINHHRKKIKMDKERLI